MGISDLEETAKRTRDNQRRAELLSQLRELEGSDEEGNQNIPTEYEKSMRTITEKLHNPKTMHDRQMHTNIPMRILSNLMNMDGIEEGLRELIRCDDLTIDGDNVKLWRKINPLDKDINKKNRFLYKTMKYSAYRRSIFYANAMQGFSGNLLELLMSVDGWRSEQGVNEVGSLANTEQQKISGQKEEGWLRQQIKKII